jgi:hypothetical protein
MGRINERWAELDSVTQSFTTLVEESLRSAETKARQIGSVLASSAEATSTVLGEQLEHLRAATGEESARTAAELRSAHKQMIAEMNEALGNAAARFRDATGELRGMAAEIQHELEATRVELKRGIMEMPQETQETAANMRRVVADQIKALNELAGLVSRSNRAVDVAPPVAVAQQVNESVAAAVSAPSRPAPRSAARPAQAPPEPIQRPTPREEAAPPEQAANDGRSGWLSELLTRASQEDEAPAATAQERSSPRAVESLDTISGDIARMIDHEAAVELWDRYRRGEPNVFTRRLYTVPGQQTFDEIRRKYRRNAEFRQTVDRYVEEFERLIAAVTREDGDHTLAETYLTSETGKVYTMLAHASGRFD